MKKKYHFTYAVMGFWTLTKFAEIRRLENNICGQIETTEWEML
jgi:hypothetical protein